MFGFLNRKISTGLVIIILLLVILFFGVIIYHQFNKLVQAREGIIINLQ